MRYMGRPNWHDFVEDGIWYISAQKLERIGDLLVHLHHAAVKKRGA